MSTIQVQTIYDLLSVCFNENDPEQLEKLKKYAQAGLINMGTVWETVLSNYLEESYQAWRDFKDFTDAKFATVSTFENNRGYQYYQATVSKANKIGTLRVCLWNMWDNDDLYFMLIPYKHYSKYNGPIKVNFHWRGYPNSVHYDYYGCTFSQVVRPLDSTEAQKLYEHNLKNKTSAEIHMA